MTQLFPQTGTATIAGYTPTYATDYGDIRVALGLAADDTDAIPDALISRRVYLPRVETAMGVVLADCEVTFGDDDDDDAAIVESVILWCASALAGGYLARRKGDQVKSQSLGPMSITYEGGQDWGKTARDLRYQAGDVMNDVCADAVLAIAGAFFAVIDDWSDSDPDADDDEDEA
jgi:hypothetical protein